MNRQIRFLALVFMTLFLIACHKGENVAYVPSAQPEVFSPYKVKVANVYNDTHEVYDVDVIGLLWNGLEDSLKTRGMLLGQKAEGEPYVMEAHIVEFRKGCLAGRCLPYVGDTILLTRVELRQGDKRIATIESKRKIGCGKGTITRNAWKKIFREVSEDIVAQAVKKF